MRRRLNTGVSAGSSVMAGGITKRRNASGHPKREENRLQALFSNNATYKIFQLFIEAPASVCHLLNVAVTAG